MRTVFRVNDNTVDISDEKHESNGIYSKQHNF